MIIGDNIINTVSGQAAHRGAQLGPVKLDISGIITMNERPPDLFTPLGGSLDRNLLRV